MNPKLTQIEAKLKVWRLTGPAHETVVDSISNLVFAHDFYREIWDEPILLGLEEFMRAHPPNLEFHGSKVQEINQRTEEVGAINNFFFSVLTGTMETAEKSLEQLTQRFNVGKELSGIQVSMSTIIGSNTEPGTKLKELVGELSTQAPAMSGPLQSCFEAVQARQTVGTVNSLLVKEPDGIGVVLPVRLKVQAGTGTVEAGVPTEESFSAAVGRAKKALQSKGWLSTSQDIIFTVEDTDATYVGSSISLPSAMAIFSSAREWQFDSYTAFTGDIDLRGSQWRIVRVEGIPEKLAAAQRAGIRRVVLPTENKNDVPDGCRSLVLIFVDDVKEVLERLTLPQTQHVETVQQQKVLLLNALCSERGWQLSAAREIQKGSQFTVTPPTADSLIISIYDSGTHTPKQHQRRELQELLHRLNQLDSPDTPIQSVNTTIVITDQQLREQIQSQLEILGPSENKSEQYCDYCFVYESGKERLIVKQYSKGKLVLQGRAGPLYRKVLEIIIPTYKLHYPNATLNIADYLASDVESIQPARDVKASDNTVALPHIGTDESGKGDYFGSLVIAGVWVDEALQESLAQLGVRDSKKLSDQQCQDLAAKIREWCQGKYHVVEISPDKYNQLHEQFVREKKNLNHLLAWGHARAIESILTRQACNQAIADQFGDEKYIVSKLMEKGKTLRLLQTPKAERFIAVAAASVLARDHFLTRLSQLSTEAGLALPKGASQTVIDVAKQIVQNHGEEGLRKFAKLHFKTTASVLAGKQS
jgi:ribonuclease HIII